MQLTSPCRPGCPSGLTGSWHLPLPRPQASSWVTWTLRAAQEERRKAWTRRSSLSYFEQLSPICLSADLKTKLPPRPGGVGPRRCWAAREKTLESSPGGRQGAVPAGAAHGPSPSCHHPGASGTTVPGGASSAAPPPFCTLPARGHQQVLGDWLVPSVLHLRVVPLLCPGSGLELWGEEGFVGQAGSGRTAWAKGSGSEVFLRVSGATELISTCVSSPPPSPQSARSSSCSHRGLSSAWRWLTPQRCRAAPPAPRNEKASVTSSWDRLHPGADAQESHEAGLRVQHHGGG